MIRSRRGDGKWPLVAWSLLLTAQPVWAQGSLRASLEALEQRGAEDPIDVDAIEKGEPAPASVSFPGLAGKARGQASAESAPVERREIPTAVSRSRAAGDDAEAGYDESGYGDEAGPPAEVPETHQVKQGDTLWSLCGHYFGDPWKWPQLWALNPQVTNPHWIFAGDSVRLRPGAGGDLPVAAEAPVDLPRARPAAAGTVKLREAGFVTTKDLKEAASISGSREEKIMLVSGDSAYLRFPKDKRLVAGERYTVFTLDKNAPIVDPKNPKKVVGYLVRIFGDVVVNQIADETSGRGTLVDTTDAIERGYLVSKRVQAFRRIKPVASDVNLEAKIVAAFSPTVMLAEQDFVVLSRGRKDGLKVGNRSYVIRKGDGYRPRMEGWDSFEDGYPKEVVAELLVVDVQDEAAVAWVARSIKEIRVGEFTETRRGY